MKSQQSGFEFNVYDSVDELEPADAALLKKAQAITHDAYAPYSQFFVGAAARLVNGEVVTGTNQENASFPVGICAERALLASAAAIFPKTAVDTMAISYHNKNAKGTNNNPISPCGMCRQALAEHENIYQRSIRLILGGMGGSVYVIEKASLLLPLQFTSDDLGM